MGLSVGDSGESNAKRELNISCTHAFFSRGNDLGLKGLTVYGLWWG